MNNIFDLPYLLISFYPGSRGFLLAKWLQLNNLVRSCGALSDDNLNVIGDNHHLTPLFADLLLNLHNDAAAVLKFTELHAQLETTDIDITRVKELINTSTLQPNIFDRVSNDCNVPYLLLTHYGSDISINNWKKIFSNIQIIKIVFENQQEFELSHQRKFLETPPETDYKFYWTHYGRPHPGSINLTVTDLADLKLDFLKDILCLPPIS